MKKVLAVALICFAAIGCNKGEAPEPSGRFLFEATTEWFADDAPGTRSYFPGESGLLYWSASDNLGVYSFQSNTFKKSGLCTINTESANTNEGKFTSRDHEYKKDWFDGDISGNDFFCAYYPVSTSSPATYTDGVLLNIPSNQTGDFGKHHICSSQKVEVSDEDLKNDRHIRFSFAPLTALLRVRLTLASTSKVEEVTISQFSVAASQTALCGDCKLTFPTSASEHGSLSSTASTGSHVINVKLATPVTITKDASQNHYIDVVLLPGSISATDVLAFSARLQNGVSVTDIGSKNTPAGGFQPGRYYLLEREITFTDASSLPDGAYTDGGFAWDNPVVNDGAYTDGGYAW